MIMIQFRNTLIYKLILILLSAFAICGGTRYSACAVEYGTVHYDKNSNVIDYSRIDKEKTQKYADLFFNKAIGIVCFLNLK